MRPAVLPVEAAPPCCSGRGVAEAGPRGPRWPLQRRCTTRASLQRPQQPERHLAAGSGRAAAPPPARSFAGALGSLASSGTIVEVEESEQQQQQRQKEQQQDQLEQQERAQQSAAAPPSANNGMRDGNGLLRNRSRPLRINLDLALVRPCPLLKRACLDAFPARRRRARRASLLLKRSCVSARSCPPGPLLARRPLTLCRPPTSALLSPRSTARARSGCWPTARAWGTTAPRCFVRWRSRCAPAWRCSPKTAAPTSAWAS